MRIRMICMAKYESQTRWLFMVGGSGINSNLKNGNLPECNGNNKVSTSELGSAFSAETCRELFETLAEWNTFLENHVPYFQEQTQEPTP